MLLFYVLKSAEWRKDVGVAVAVVDIEAVHPWREDEFIAACATYYAAGYWAWEISNVRPIMPSITVAAKRKIYLIDIEH